MDGERVDGLLCKASDSDTCRVLASIGFDWLRLASIGFDGADGVDGNGVDGFEGFDVDVGTRWH